MKVSIFRNDERVHEWFLNCDDPNEVAMTITNCGHSFVRVSVEEFRRMQNELEEIKAKQSLTELWQEWADLVHQNERANKWERRYKELAEDYVLLSDSLYQISGVAKSAFTALEDKPKEYKDDSPLTISLAEWYDFVPPEEEW